MRPLLQLVLTSALAAAASASFAVPKVMFATLEVDTGKLGDWAIVAGEGLTGIAAGNKICQDLAEAASLGNFALYRAWLSDDFTDAYCNVAGFSGKRSDNCGEDALPDAGPWVRTDGKPFAASLSALTNDELVLYAPNVDQHGQKITTGFLNVMTGTGEDGTALGSNCNGWISEAAEDDQTIGEIDGGTHGWTNWSGWTCDQTLHLFCFESGVGTPLPPIGGYGADVFVTSASGNGALGTWTDANGQLGLAAGDEICRTVAARGHRPSPDSYVAWLSSDTVDAADAIDRLTFPGPWRRADGVEVAATKAALQVVPHDAAINLDETGEPSSYYAFTGTTTNGIATASTCGDWLATVAQATEGISSTASFFWSDGSGGNCTNTAHLLCFSNVGVLFADGFERYGTAMWSKKFP